MESNEGGMEALPGKLVTFCTLTCRVVTWVYLFGKINQIVL